MLHSSIFRFEEDFDVQLLADMLISLTNIVKHLEGQFADEEESGLDVLIKLGRYVIISYPKVPFRFQINVKRALVRSFIQIACINEYFLETFLDQIGKFENRNLLILSEHDVKSVPILYPVFSFVRSFRVPDSNMLTSD